MSNDLETFGALDPGLHVGPVNYRSVSNRGGQRQHQLIVRTHEWQTGGARARSLWLSSGVDRAQYISDLPDARDALWCIANRCWWPSAVRIANPTRLPRQKTRCRQTRSAADPQKRSAASRVKGRST